MGCSESKAIKKIEDDEDETYLSVCKTKYDLIKKSAINDLIKADTGDTYLSSCKTAYNIDAPTPCLGYTDGLDSKFGGVFQQFLDNGRKTFCETTNDSPIKEMVMSMIKRINENGPINDISEFKTEVLSRENESSETMTFIGSFIDALVEDGIVTLDESGNLVFDDVSYKTALGCSENLPGVQIDDMFTRPPRQQVEEIEDSGSPAYTLKYNDVQVLKRRVKLLDIAIAVMLLIVITLLRNKK